MKSLFILIFLLMILPVLSTAQTIQHVDPPFWWTGMVNPELQIMIHGENVSSLQPEINYEGLKVKQVTKLESPNYLVVDLVLAENVKPGSFNINLKRGRRTAATYAYQLNERAEGSSERIGFNTSDVMYLITPDRFANGDPSNDTVVGLTEPVGRDKKGGRHGGDIQGLIDNLDYIKDMGFTAIWVNPVLENNMPEYSYHGYATTDFYKVDARFGTNEQYKELIDKCHQNGIKMIMDMIVNHGGTEHWWKNDLPASDWYNYQKEYLVEGNYTGTTHRKSVIQDPYASKRDLKEFTDGWFVTAMPDLNQRNPVMAKYLIQNAIWWIEYSGVDGIRMDTYPYPDMDFMTDWTCAVQNEYPYFNTVGEEWNEDPAIVSYWQQGKENSNGYTSCLPSVMDFPLQAKVAKSLKQDEKDFEGWVTLYSTLGLDFQYADPYNLVVFPDNHDMSRFYTQVDENYDLFKLGITYILTVRGIPQIYYGSEILMKNPGTTDHGIIRSDFPGGWEGDEVNAFTGDGLTDLQKEAQGFFKTLLNWRKNQSAVHDGKLMHYDPEGGIYVLFRYTDTDKVMVVLSKSAEENTLDLSRFDEMLQGNESGTEIISGSQITFDGTLTVPAMTPMVIDLD